MSAKRPLNLTLVMNRVLQQSNSTGWTPPIGSTIAAETVPATGAPPFVTVIDHGQRAFTLGVWVVALKTTSGPVAAPAESGRARATTRIATNRRLTGVMLFRRSEARP